MLVQILFVRLRCGGYAHHMKVNFLFMLYVFIEPTWMINKLESLLRIFLYGIIRWFKESSSSLGGLDGDHILWSDCMMGVKQGFSLEHLVLSHWRWWLCLYGKSLNKIYVQKRIFPTRGGCVVCWVSRDPSIYIAFILSLSQTRVW